MSELVIVVADWYGRPALAPLPLAALRQLARLGAAQETPHSWRAWLASYLGRSDLAAAAPAAVAAAAMRAVSPETFIWLVSAMHLTASLTSVHLDPAGLLSLDHGTQSRLAASFAEHFGDRGYRLEPARSGGFLMEGPSPPGDVQTVEPARCLGASIAEAQPRGAGATSLRALTGEIEMWLHEHPLNRARVLEQRLPITALWPWGGGRPVRLDASDPARDISRAGVAVFSDDSYVEGLCRIRGIQCAPAPQTLGPVLAVAADRRIVTVEIFSPLGRASAATPLDALVALDRDWMQPALDALNRGGLSRITLLANDRRISLAARDRLKFWRRGRGALDRLG